MKYLFLLAVSVGFMLVSCSKPADKPAENEVAAEAGANPFFSKYETPFEVAPFDKIKFEHYKPAFDKGIAERRAEIKAISENTEAPTFVNTIEALEKSGKLLGKVSSVLFNLKGANTTDEINGLVTELTPTLTALGDEVNMNKALFTRVKAIYDQKDKLELNLEQAKLLKDYYKGFVRGGALLEGEAKEKMKVINTTIAKLTNQFGDNVLKETNAFQMFIEKEEDLIGLPEGVVGAAAIAAEAAGKKGQWLFTIQKPSLLPFLTYSQKRELREKMFYAYTHMGDNDDANDNKVLASKIAKLRIDKANLLGYKSHADYTLEETMAKTPAKVFELLNKMWKPALANAKKEAADLQAMIKKEGGDFKLEPWDWWFYSEKVKKDKFDLDEEQLRPYFKIENVRDGAFALATKLYGITFEERTDIPVYHPEAKAFEVKEADGKHIGILYVDYFPRASKRGGAWMNAFRSQQKFGGDITPVICNVCNFTPPVGDTPSLLSFEEVTTLFHEFGHALHGLLSNCYYPSLAGTNVSRDFVELPSQVMENWASEPELLKVYAKHYKTGEVIPDELIAKIQKAGKFNQGFITTEFLAAAFLDMKWHTLTEAKELDAEKFENETLTALGLIPEIVVRYRTSYFRHIFSSPTGYSSGYYSYIWSGVLDADAFQAFKETSLFDQKTAALFRDNVLSRGGTEDPSILYKRFRGAEPNPDALMIRRGLK